MNARHTACTRNSTQLEFLFIDLVVGPPCQILRTKTTFTEKKFVSLQNKSIYIE